MVLGGHEPKGRGVDAVTHPTPVGGAVVKEVAQMAVAVRGADLGLGHPVTGVAELDDVVRLERMGETRPAAVTVELADRGEDGLWCALVRLCHGYRSLLWFAVLSAFLRRASR